MIVPYMTEKKPHSSKTKFFSIAGKHEEENSVQLVSGWRIFTIIKDVVIIAVRRREHEKWQQEEIPGSESKKVERKKS